MKFLCSGIVLFLFLGPQASSPAGLQPSRSTTACRLLSASSYCSRFNASAQASSDPSDVIVLQDKWRIEVNNPALEKDPFSANKERQSDEAAQKATARANENRIRQGETALPPPVRKPTPETGSGRLSVSYVYEFKLRNTGRKEIRALTLEYAFFEPGTQREVGRLRFVRQVRMKPGSTKHLTVRTASSPTGTLDATKAGKKERDQYSTQVVIRHIEYADGSIWESASNY